MNAAFGQSSIHREALDDDPEHINDHPIRTQTGISAGVVYHAYDSLHFDIDYLRAMFRWYGGAKEDVNYLNAGVTVTW